VPPLASAALPAQTLRSFRFAPLAEDPDTGGWTGLLTASAGHIGGAAHPHELEYHTPQEEIFVLSGSVEFGDFYRVTAPAYLNHPPYWTHPAEQRFDRQRETRMLIRLSKPIDTFYVPIPDSWDGQEFDAGSPPGPRGRAISRLQLDDLLFAPLVRDGLPTREEAAVLWENPAEGLVTWLWRVPAGWRGSGAGWREPGGYDEVYVLEGDLTTRFDGAPVRLERGWYYCTPEVIEDAGASAFTERGLLAVRWTRPTPRLVLPPITHAAFSE
jgi:hypothetical protein